jgi:hypothetical protein
MKVPSNPEEARQVADAYLDAHLPLDLRGEVVSSQIADLPTCWVFGYQTRGWLEDGSISDALAGNGPIIVNKRTGHVRDGTSALPIDDQADPE